MAQEFDASLDRRLRNVQRSAFLLVLFAALVGFERWLRGDRFFPLWTFALAGGAFAWCGAAMWWLRRQMARRAARDA